MKSFLVTLFFLFGISANSFATDWKFVYVDTFDNANNNTVDYGLNDRMDERRLYLPNLSGKWVRKFGSWYDRPVIREWWSQVNHPVSGQNQLSFHSELSAVMLDTPITPSVEGGGEYSISVTTDPIIGSVSDTEFTSIMLHSDKNSRGWVTETNLGFFIKADGGMALFQNGNQKILSTNFVTPAETYDVELNIKPGFFRATVNGDTITALLDESIPSSAYLYLGAYFVNSGKVSTFDNLVVKTAQSSEKRLKHYGYYWAVSADHGDNIDDSLLSYTNFNFVDNVDNVNSINCPRQSCVVQIRWEFWSGVSLLPNWKALWASTLSKIKASKQYIAAVYQIDEPLWNGVSPDDFDLVVKQVKSDLAEIDMPIKQMAVFSEPEVNPSKYPILPYFADLDYIGFDLYKSVDEFDQVEKALDDLKQSQPLKPVILVPQTYFSGTSNDADTAKINWMYYDLALKDQSVVGLMNFGLWTGSQPSQVPITLKVQKLIGHAILN